MHVRSWVKFPKGRTIIGFYGFYMNMPRSAISLGISVKWHLAERCESTNRIIFAPIAIRDDFPLIEDHIHFEHDWKAFAKLLCDFFLLHGIHFRCLIKTTAIGCKCTFHKDFLKQLHNKVVNRSILRDIFLLCDLILGRSIIIHALGGKCVFLKNCVTKKGSIFKQ